ncbi:MAG: glycine-rich domain-containing protein [Bacteroidota bacterium]
MKQLITSIMLLLALYQTKAQTADFKNSRTFLSSSTFPLPKGVTQIKVELWGGGGGGCAYGGGGGGAYGRAILNVSEFSSVQIVVGSGGRGGLETGTDGGITLVRFNTTSSATTYSFSVRPGSGAVIGSSLVQGGEGGVGAVMTPNDIGYYFEAGEDGTFYLDSYRQIGTATITTRNYGKGGNAGNTIYTGGRGGVYASDRSAVWDNHSEQRYGSSGKLPGGGGGGNKGTGFNGASGMVIVSW